jgi:hypothetical protein
VSISISGQNERWAQLAAQPPSTPRTGPNSRTGSTVGTTASRDAAANAVPYGTAPTGAAPTGTAPTGTTPAGTSGVLSESLSFALTQEPKPVMSDPAANSATSATLASRTPRPSAISGPPPGPPYSGAAISNTGTTAPDTNTGGPKPGYSDSVRQQFARSAYGALAPPTPDNPATTASQASITV